VFVEVRSRSGTSQGGAAASIGSAKRARLILAARHYLARLPVLPPCRFDVVAIDQGCIEWIPAAFDGG
jgi:putative endonuclease